MRVIRTPNLARRPATWNEAVHGPWPKYTEFSGVRYGETFVKGKAFVEDDAKAHRLVVDLGYVDVTDEERALSAAERARLAPTEAFAVEPAPWRPRASEK